MNGKLAKIFWTGRSQAVRLPKEFRFPGDTVLVRRGDGDTIILEPTEQWPERYVESFTGVPDDFERQAQGKTDRRQKIG